MYLVTDIANIAVIKEYPATMPGFREASLTATVLAQMVEMYPSGIMIERRNADMTVTSIVRITNMKVG